MCRLRDADRETTERRCWIEKLRNAAVLNGTPSTSSGVLVEIGVVVLLVVVVMVGYWPFAIMLRLTIRGVNGFGADSLLFQLALLPVGQRPSRKRNV